MRLPLIFLLCASATNGAVDLAGEWRRHDGDDPHWAAPDFDDRHWPRVTMPLNPSLGPTYWLRRQVVLTEPLAEPGLAFGSFALRYEIWLDGVKVAVARPRATSSYFPPRWFALATSPLRAGATVTLALRVESGEVPIGFYRSLPDLGPYRLASRQEVQSATEFVWLRHRQALVLTELAAHTQLLIAFLLALFWISGVRRKDLAWFAAFLLSAGSFNWLMLASAYREIDRTWPLLLLQLTLACLGTSLERLSGGSARWSWVIAAASSLAVAAGALSGAGGVSIGMMGVILFAPFGPIGRWTLGAWRANHLGRAVALPVFGYLAFTVNTLFEATFSTWPIRSSFFAGPFQVFFSTWISAIFGITVSVILIQNAARERREKARLAREMEAAREVQRLLLTPLAAPPAYAIEAAYEPAAEVGGDFHYRLPDGDAQLLVVGDVSGKGLRAAMLVTLVVGVLRSTAERRPGRLLAVLNRALAGQTGGGFVTCCCARFEPDGRVTLANAGHLPPLADGRELELPGLPLGVVPDVDYAEVLLEAREFVFLSDGVIEAENAQRELFGFQRTREISAKSAAAIAATAKAWGQNDDITVVTVRRTA